MTIFLGAQAQNRTLYFVQEDDTVLPVNDQLVLKKAPFEIRTTLVDNDVVISNLSIDSANMAKIKSGTPADSLHCFRPGTGMSDYPRNSKKWLMVKPTDNAYWPYVTKFNRSKFDKDSAVGSEFLVVRTVENLIFFDCEITGEHPIANAPIDRLFLIYYTYYDVSDTDRERTDVRTLEIRFTKG